MDDPTTCPPGYQHVDLCVDCVFAVEYYEGSEGISSDWPGLLPWARAASFGVALHADDTPKQDPHFSKHPCVACGSGLAGDRYEYVATIQAVVP
jgi:hypothetical protein